MAKIYKGKVSVYKNTKNQLVLKGDDDGAFDYTTAKECFDAMKALAKKHKLELRFYQPAGEPGCDTPLLMADRWGKPYIALLPARKAPSMPDGYQDKPKVTKLA